MKQIRMTSKTGKMIYKKLVRKCLDQHDDYDCPAGTTDTGACVHKELMLLDIARFLEHALVINQRDAVLTLECPYLLDVNPNVHLYVLRLIAMRLTSTAWRFGKSPNSSISHVAESILEFTNRNAMQIIAEASL